ncbi:MAG: hypothetical protein IM568_12525 [Flavobacterium sp.]|nr:hypothetical protein [Flavobacterium sp.]
MKYTNVIAIIFLFIFSSCSKQPSCDDEESIELAKQLIVKEMNGEIGTQYKMIGIDVKEVLEKFINENIEIINARTTAKDESLKKCDCSSQISIKYSDDFIQKIEEQENKTFLNGVLTSYMSKQLNYNYTLQIINKNDELFIEGNLPIKELSEAFSFYLMASIEFKKKTANQEQSLNFEKNDKNLQDSLTTNNIINSDIYNDSADKDTVKSYVTYQANVDKAIEMLKRGKSVSVIADSTVLLKEDIRKLKRKLQNDE